MIDSETVTRLLDNIRKNQQFPLIVQMSKDIESLEISQSQLDSIKLRISELNKVPFATKVSRVPLIRDPCPPVSCDSLVPGSLIVKVSALNSIGYRIRAIEDNTNLIHKQMSKLRESVLEKPREEGRRKLSSNNVRAARDKCFRSIRKQATLLTKTMDERKPFMSDVEVDEALRAEAFAQNSFCARILNY